ncbi:MULTISPECIES: hypothetical protein, partial [unclassified Nocardioides]|uniref:hypothetical protein n=1 Tax=unclassified Nocardioides TaxID=2615069 RepID=UPI0009F01146
MHLASGRELGQAQLADQGSAVTTDLDQPVLAAPGAATTGTPARVGGVEVGPVGDQQEVLELGRPTVADRALGCGEGAAGVELVEADSVGC